MEGRGPMGGGGGRPAPQIRGMLGEDGDASEWLDAVARFPNGVPRFDSRADALDFMEDYLTHHGGSNPENPTLMHIFTMLTSWEQVETMLLPNIEKARAEPSFAKTVPLDYLQKRPEDNGGEPSRNIYEQRETDAVVRDVCFRLNLPFHRCTSRVSTHNTLKYLFFHMKCGIFVMIRNGKLRIFAPFVNSDYRNTWGDHLKVEGNGSLDEYYREKRKYYRPEHVERDRSKWWANGNIICNEMSKPEDKKRMQFWGDHFLAPLRDMLGEACRERQMPDCEFFLNKRDYPQLKVNVEQGLPVEPYGFIFDKDDRDPNQDVPLAPRALFNTYAPIVSFYAASPQRFADIPWPSSEDWEAACGLVFPHSFMHRRDKGKVVIDSNPRDLFTEENFRKFERSWDDGRVATAFFRGTATGGGTTIHDNQRLMVAHLSHEWMHDEEKGGEEPFLDAAIVGWNLRDKKTAHSRMTFLRPKTFGFTAGKHHFTPIYEQSKYKYLLYVDGHCAACRYGFMMRLGSVILKVESRQVADTMWYFPLLQPTYEEPDGNIVVGDHVPVKSDLSDLEEKIRWCRRHDDICRQIGENSKAFYEKYVSRSALLDYLEMVCHQIAKRFVQPPVWWEAPPPAAEPPRMRKPDTECYHDKQKGIKRLCVRCQELLEEERREQEDYEARAAAERKDKSQNRQRHRDRMRRLAHRRR